MHIGSIVPFGTCGLAEGFGKSGRCREAVKALVGKV
jgi:hypothetical protein